MPHTTAKFIKNTHKKEGKNVALNTYCDSFLSWCCLSKKNSEHQISKFVSAFGGCFFIITAHRLSQFFVTLTWFLIQVVIALIKLQQDKTNLFQASKDPWVNEIETAMHFLVWCLANCEKNCTAALSLKLAVEIWLCLTLTSALQVRIAEQYFLRCPRVVMKWMLSRRQRRRHVSVAAIFSAKCCLLDLLILWFSFHKELNSFFSNLSGHMGL